MSEHTDLRIYVRHPSEAYIKYLMTIDRKDAEDNQWVRHEVAGRGFPEPEEEYLDAIRTYLLSQRPRDFRPKDKYHKTTTKFLKREGIYGLHYPDDAAKEANALVGDLRNRKIVEQLLLGGVKPKQISAMLRKNEGFDITPEGIEAYKIYYWQVHHLRVEDWATLLADSEHQLNRIQSILECGAGLALHLSGFQEQLESKQVLKDMLSGVYWDFKEWAAQPRSLGRTKAMTALARSAVTLDTQISGKADQINAAWEAFEKFRIEYAQKEVPPIQDVAPLGNFSKSGSKLIDDAEIEDEDEDVGDPEEDAGELH